jgi:hypothetical protein
MSTLPTREPRLTYRNGSDKVEYIIQHEEDDPGLYRCQVRIGNDADVVTIRKCLLRDEAVTRAADAAVKKTRVTPAAYASSVTASEGDTNMETAHASQSDNKNGIKQGLHTASIHNDKPKARNENDICEPSPSQMKLIGVQRKDHGKSNRRTSPVHQRPIKRRRTTDSDWAGETC